MGQPVLPSTGYYTQQRTVFGGKNWCILTVGMYLIWAGYSSTRELNIPTLPSSRKSHPASPIRQWVYTSHYRKAGLRSTWQWCTHLISVFRAFVSLNRHLQQMFDQMIHFVKHTLSYRYLNNLDFAIRVCTL